MPIYEYECARCGNQHEILQKFSEGTKRKCPSCGELGLKRLVSAAAFHLKGTGWYVTDFRDKDKPGKDKKDKANGKDGGKETKSESKGAESSAKSPASDSSKSDPKSSTDSAKS